MGLLSLLFRDPLIFLMLVPALLYSVIFHEVAHGWVASLFGDNTAKYAGRLSLNPVSHIDPLGALMVFLVGFGWAKPVPVDYNNLGGSRKAIIAVSLAGCLANIIIAAIAMFLLQSGIIYPNSLLFPVMRIVAEINIILGAFNLIPIPPLDGSRVVREFLPYELKMKLARIEPFGFFIIIILLYTGILSPVIDFIRNFILFFIGLLLGFFR